MNELEKIKSPRTGEYYTINDVLEKGFTRSGLYIKSYEIKLFHIDPLYSSKDYVISFEGLQCSEPLFNNSVSFVVNGSIPVHRTKNGKISYGFGNGDNPILSHNILKGEILFWLNDQTEEISLISLEEEDLKKIFLLLKEVIFRVQFLSY